MPFKANFEGHNQKKNSYFIDRTEKSVSLVRCFIRFVCPGFKRRKGLIP